MTRTVACVDGSPYAASVCDHAVWLSSMSGGSVTALHATEEDETGLRSERVLGKAEARLRDHGAAVEVELTPGAFAQALQPFTSDVIVLGKRGERSGDDRSDLGSNAAAALRGHTGPLCLVSRVYLPIQRALVLVDANAQHRRAIETVAGIPVLGELELDIVMLQPDGADGSEKLAWARRRLGGRSADIYPMSFGAPEALAAQYLAEHGTDLIVFSREMMFDPHRATLGSPEDQAVWGWRVPVFVC